MQLTIISPTGKTEHTVDWLEAQSTTGSFVLKPNHAPIIAHLAPGKDIIFSHGDQQEKYYVADGLLKLVDNHILVIVTQ